MTVSAYNKRQIEHRTVAALWYAFGLVDFAPGLGLTTDDAFKFSEEETARAAAYYGGTGVYFLPSINDSLRRYVDAKAPAPVE